MSSYINAENQDKFERYSEKVTMVTAFLYVFLTTGYNYFFFPDPDHWIVRLISGTFLIISIIIVFKLKKSGKIRRSFTAWTVSSLVMIINTGVASYLGGDSLFFWFLIGCSMICLTFMNKKAMLMHILFSNAVVAVVIYVMGIPILGPQFGVIATAIQYMAYNFVNIMIYSVCAYSVAKASDEAERSLVQLTSALESADAANKAKSNFLATMSHEIRTPMNAILGITQILIQNDEFPREYVSEINKIYVSGSNLLGIINDILDMSKIETGKMELSPEEYDVPSLINDAVQLNVVRIGSKPIEFILDIDETLPLSLIGDELRLKQILNNLLSNGIKYTESGYVKLSVSHSEEGGEVSLNFVVEDTGQGMKLEDRDSFFSEYSRFNTETNRSTEGTGLGLSITKKLVEMMDGTIWAESEYGKGSIFMVMVKQGAVDCKTIGAELAKQLSSFEFRGNQQFDNLQITREPMPYGSVLVVDDVETNLYVAKGLMMPYHLKIETATSGFSAIDLVSDGSIYDIIFMDHMMPKMDGIETTKRLRDAGYAKPIVALTANAVVGQAEVFFENGFDDFISKPIDMRQLNAILNKYIRDKQLPEVVEEARRQNNTKKENTGNTALEAELLKVFVKDAKKIVPIIEAVYRNVESATDDDFRTYVINVHAMKSALANIGEKKASKTADLLERAGKNKDKNIIKSETGDFIEALRSIIGRIDLSSHKDESGSIDEDSDFLREQLKLIKAACEDYDDLAVESIITGLRKMSWSSETNDLLDNISELILHSEFEKAILECTK
ncbi:MAG: ATP-binding protein [Defluviitaleaceae bacterium]|nr:ATP-binding protein [Defluviitaleaceae bacterium]